jgi:tetratricopeptide (TPR) repeat protein
MSADLNSLLAPNDDKLFEQLCQHVLEHRCKSLWGQAYGRNGQKQFGVDFYIEVPAGSEGDNSAAVQIIGVQCKHKDRLLEGELSAGELEAEVQKAKGFKPALTTFIIATSAPTDIKPQDKARELTAEHQKLNPPSFSVEVWFWEKIRSEFSKDRDLLHEILRRFHPNLIPVQSAQHSVLHQLPAKPAHFIGRDEDLAELEKQLTSAHKSGATISGKHAGLQGMGGVGKTALASVLAHNLKDHYPDAQLYLNLRGADPDHRPPVKPVEAMQIIIHAFQPEAKLPEELDKLAAIYHGVLNDAGRVMLFLDNAADADQIRPLLPPANCLLLVTSRTHFSLPGMAARNIDCLPPEESQALLLTLAPRIKSHEKETAELCGHLPLALEVFAGVVNDKNLYPVPDLLERLRKQPGKLTKADAAFQVSYEMLENDLRRRWSLLAVFPVSFDLPAAAAVWKEKENSALEAMQTLANASLVEWNQANGRFRLHDLVRQFSDGKLTDSERTAAKLHYAEHYRDVINASDELYKKGGENVLCSLELFDRERTHIEAAFEWLQSRKDQKSATLFATTVDLMGNAGSLRFYPRQRMNWLESQLLASRLIKDRKAECKAIGYLGVAYADLGDARKAIEFFNQSLAISREIAYRRGESGSLGNLGLAHAHLGEQDRS